MKNRQKLHLNELKYNDLEITFENGILIVIESRDDAAMADES